MTDKDSAEFKELQTRIQGLSATLLAMVSSFSYDIYYPKEDAARLGLLRKDLDEAITRAQKLLLESSGSD